jgi:DNA repair photolyase
MTGLRVYTGLFLYSPDALHLDGPPCAYDCAYCFTRWKKDVGHPLKTKSVSEWREYLHTRTAWLGWYIWHKKSVCVSNTFDPFAPGDHRIIRPLMQACLEEGIPLNYQTKTGPEVLGWAKDCPKANWYLTITSDSEASQHIESRAPCMAARRKTAEKLIELGHTVSIGVNPCVPAWWNNPAAFLRWAEGAGICGLVVYPLHLAQDVTPECEKRLGPELMKLGRAKGYPNLNAWGETTLPLCHWDNEPWKFWDASNAVYPAGSHIPTVPGFWKTRKTADGQEWYCKDAVLQDWLTFVTPQLPNELSKTGCHDYMGASMARDVNAQTAYKTFNGDLNLLLAWQWNSSKRRIVHNHYSEIIGTDSAGNALRRYRPAYELPI